MAENKDFKIQIKGVKAGKSLYEFSIDDSFFNEFENSFIFGASLNVKVEIEKGGGYMNIKSLIVGDVVVECDRCLDNLSIPLNFECSMGVKFAKSNMEQEYEGDDILVLDPSEGEIDLKQFLYDYICINLPLQKVHPEGECNKEMIEKIESYKVDEKENDEVANSPFGKLGEMLKEKSDN